MIDPIKPKKQLRKSIDFRKGDLKIHYFTGVDLSRFRSPGVYTSVGEITNDYYSRLRQMFNEGHPDPSRSVTMTAQQPTHTSHLLFGTSPGLVMASPSRGYISRGYISRGEGTDVDMVRGGEQMMYEASTTMILSSPKKKKTIWGRIKDFFKNIYSKQTEWVFKKIVNYVERELDKEHTGKV